MKNRLGDIQERLSGREMALAEIRRDLEISSMRDSLMAGLCRLTTEKPLCTRIAEAIENAQNWKDQRALSRAIAAHQREALVLVKAWLACNERVMTEIEAAAAKAQHLATVSCLVIESSLRSGEDSPRPTKRKKQRGITGTEQEKLATDRSGFWVMKATKLAEELLGELYRTRFAIEWLGREYFGGLQLLFSDLYRRQRNVLAMTIRLVRGLNHIIEFVAGGEFCEEAYKARMDSVVRIAEVRATAEGAIRPIVAIILQGATAAAHGVLDEDTEAAAIYKRLFV